MFCRNHVLPQQGLTNSGISTANFYKGHAAILSLLLGNGVKQLE
jgi:hypothetical protein